MLLSQCDVSSLQVLGFLLGIASWTLTGSLLPVAQSTTSRQQGLHLLPDFLASLYHDIIYTIYLITNASIGEAHV
jgi:hypothetical protein